MARTRVSRSALRRAPAWLAALAIALAPDTVAVAASDGQPGDALQAREALLARLRRLSASGQFLFGQQKGTVWGTYLDGRSVSTGEWYARTVGAGRWTSDAAALTGDHPGVLGVGLDMLAFDPPDHARGPKVAEAIRRHVAAGGVATLDWHPPSCTAPFTSGGVLATYTIAGQTVPIHASRGGSHFYADESYTRPITSVAAVPESLRCLCRIANDETIPDGPYRGVTGKAWLVGVAKHAAATLRAHGLGGLPLIVRPFHEQNGTWFWWGRPYWSCTRLLGKRGAVSGAAAYRQVVRDYVAALRAEPGMEALLFAHSPDKLAGPAKREELSPAERKLQDPSSLARDLSRRRMLAELTALRLAFQSPAQRRATLPFSRVRTPAQERRYVAQARRLFREAYPGDDVVDVLGIDLYFPSARAATAADLRRMSLYLRAVAAEAKARGKPHALTETGTYRLPLIHRVHALEPGQPLRLFAQTHVAAAYARLVHDDDRREFLDGLGLRAVGDVTLDPTEVTALFPDPRAYREDWFHAYLLPLAKGAKVAYALVWQTYVPAPEANAPAYYYVPFPGHPEADGFVRFHRDAATCFLADRCAER